MFVLGIRSGLFRAGPHKSLHHRFSYLVSAAAAGSQPVAGAPAQHLLSPEGAPGLGEGPDAQLDDGGPGGAGTVRRLPLQRHHGQLGEEEAGVGHVDGERSDCQ